DEMTMEDPDALAEPFHTTARYRRDRYGALLEFECSQNDRNPVDETGETTYLVPGAESRTMSEPSPDHE
uniref:hypothetical protein n=1 Tax=Altererythrobacter segetis TaxID=1104773 RepID=UPI001A9C479D